MNRDEDWDSRQLQGKLQALATDICTLATSHQGNPLALLTVLRTLEHVHREIREDLFQTSLPDNRQILYALLKDMEEAGGWPYIERMKLQSLLSCFPEIEVYTADDKSEE